MDDKSILNILNDVRKGKLTVGSAMEKLRDMPYEDIVFAKVDHHRHIRQGVPEVIFATGKTDEQVISIAGSMYRKSKSFLVTKSSENVYRRLGIKSAKYHPSSGMISIGGARKKRGFVLVLTAGTSDIPVAEEAAVTAEYLGSNVETIYDVGVAGIHRIMDNRGTLRKARVVVVVAGMEGALPSVVGGMTDKPVIAVPTSVGYGTSLGGMTALFAMLNSCVPGIAVMNIDNGFGAGCLAHKINTIK